MSLKTELDDMYQHVREQNTIVASVSAFIRGLSDRLAAALANENADDAVAEVREIAQAIAANSAVLAEAVQSNVGTSTPAVVIGTPDTPEAVAAHAEIAATNAASPDAPSAVPGSSASPSSTVVDPAPPVDVPADAPPADVPADAPSGAPTFDDQHSATSFDSSK
jgi:hypothetical protein